jgi:N6-L-threonylcarbamoyladenine synthase
MLCLGIETSCDETSAAVVEDGNRIRSNIVASQVDIHKQYGGVVPELASRRHVEQVVQVVDLALDKAGVTLEEINLVGVTRGPGLVGALLVGLSFAKAVAYALRLPFVGVHHLEGHLHAVMLEQKVDYPFLGLVVSGGHTELIDVKEFGQYTVLGKTRDDAVGEAFDKVAKMMGLGYPGGPVLDVLAGKGDPGFTVFPRSMLSKGSLDFSFSGLKTSVLNFLLKSGWGPEGEGAETFQEKIPDIAASFQEAAVGVLVDKAIIALEKYRFERLVLSGGVASNRHLRERLKEETKRRGVDFFAPSPILCTDNAAMIAAVATRRFQRGEQSSLDLNATSTLPLGEF